MAVVKACNAAGTAVKNTGSRCAAMLQQLAMTLHGSTTLEIPANVIENDNGTLFLDWIKEHLHAIGGQKVFPFGGNRQAYNDTITNNTDPTVYTAPVSGVKKQMLAGSINLTLNTLEGGLCLAKALQTIGTSNLGVIMVDDKGGFLLKKNSNGTYGFFSSQNSPGSLILQNKETPFQNSLNVSLNPQTVIQLGEYFVENSGGLLEMFGLTDVEVDSRAAATATTVHAGGTFECGGGDIFDEYGVAIAIPAAWKITKADGTLITITGVVQDATTKSYVLTFATQTSGTVLKVDLAASDVLFDNDVLGIESVNGGVVVTVP